MTKAIAAHAAAMDPKGVTLGRLFMKTKLLSICGLMSDFRMTLVTRDELGQRLILAQWHWVPKGLHKTFFSLCW